MKVVVDGGYTGGYKRSKRRRGGETDLKLTPPLRSVRLSPRVIPQAATRLQHMMLQQRRLYRTSTPSQTFN